MFERHWPENYKNNRAGKSLAVLASETPCPFLSQTALTSTVCTFSSGILTLLTDLDRFTLYSYFAMDRQPSVGRVWPTTKHPCC